MLVWIGVKRNGTCFNRARLRHVQRHGGMKGHVWEERAVLCVLAILWEVSQGRQVGPDCERP